MAKFRDSAVADNDVTTVDAAAASHAAPAQAGRPCAGTDSVIDRSIGDILADLHGLKSEDVERVLIYQRQKGVRFGEAAVALGIVSQDDVYFALSQQFHYPYAPGADRQISAELVTLSAPFTPRAEQFRALRSQLIMRALSEVEVRRPLAVISPEIDDGKTYTACNLAVVLAQLGGRVLLVDADMRKPRVHEVFKLSNGKGLSGILSGRSDNNVIQQVATVPALFVLPVGPTPPNPLELVERPAFGLLMSELANKFDHVLVDTPAAVHGADPSVISARCGLALVIARKHRSRVSMLQDLIASFGGSGARVAGVVVNEH